MGKEIVFFDTETTGFPHKDDNSQPHIVQLAAIVADADSKKIKQSINLIVSPNGWDIPEVCQEIHGITTSYAIEVGIPERAVINIFMLLIKSSLCVAYNVDFDKKIMEIAIKRFFGDYHLNEFKDRDYFCTMNSARKIMGGKNKKLGEAYKYFCKKEMKNAHDAMADTEACMEIYWQIQSRCYRAGLRE